MKKFVILLLCIFSIPLAFAEDCMHDPVYETNWNAIVTTGARVRSIPCMETSTVLTTLPVGEVITVIATTDGWYKIRRSDGTEGWIGQWLITETNQTPPSPTPAPQPTEPLYDILGHVYETAIRYLYEAGVISGYSDNSFKPDATINRAEFTKIIIGATTDPGDMYGENCFPDVHHEWFAPYVCTAQRNNIIKGYPDGTFKPNATINFAESALIITQAFGYTFEPSDPWYKNAVEQLSSLHDIPLSIMRFGQKITRGEMSEIMYRLKLGIIAKVVSTKISNRNYLLISNLSSTK